MSTLEGDFWVCAECRSINNARAKQCYNCRTPRDLAAVDPAMIEGTGHGKLREIALPPFRSPRPYAAIASILILAVAGLEVVLTVGTTTLLLQVLDGTKATREQLAYIGMVGLTTLAVGIVALVSWSLWLSRAVTSMPALGLGYPAASGLMAFVENFLPGLNLLRVPAIVRDVVRRLEPGSTAGQSRGEALIFAAWVGLLGGFVIPRLGAFLSGFSSDSPADVIRSNLTIGGIATGLVLVGALFLVALIWWIEERIDRRREAQLAEIDAKAAGATADPSDGVEEATPPTSAPTPSPAASPAPAPAAAASPSRPTDVPAGWSWGGSAASPLAAQTAGAAASVPSALMPGPASAAAAQPTPGEPKAPTVPLAAGWERAPIPSGETGQDADARHAWADWQPPTVSIEPGVGPQTDSAPAPDAAAAADATQVVGSPPAAEAAPMAEAAPEAAPEGLEPGSASVQGLPPAAPPEPDLVQEPAPTSTTNNGAPHLTIRVGRMGMLQAEMAGETEPVMLEDLPAYGAALANAGGTAEIVLSPGDSMSALIARRAQIILADAGIEAALPD